MTIPERRELPHDAFIDYIDGWLLPAEADDLKQALTHQLEWEQRSIVLFGREILQPRLIAWAGAVPYRYSGSTLEPRAGPAVLDAVNEKVSGATGVPFNHVLVNRYRDGQDGMGFHADDEPELGARPVVATLSLGVTRRLVVVSRRGKAVKLAYPLSHGSLLVMGGACQEHYRHGVPKERGLAGERLSLTFRRIR